MPRWFDVRVILEPLQLSLLAWALIAILLRWIWRGGIRFNLELWPRRRPYPWRCGWEHGTDRLALLAALDRLTNSPAARREVDRERAQPTRRAEPAPRMP